MAKVIHKFPFKFPVDEVQLRAPKFLHVAEQNQTACLWAEIDESAPLESYLIKFVGTGHFPPVNGQHIGSFMSNSFVWHIYVEKVEHNADNY